MGTTQDTDAASFEEGPVTPSRIGLAAGVMDIVAFAAVGYVALDDVAVGGIAGLMVGIGVYLFLPLFVTVGEDGSLEELAPEADGAPLRSFHRLAAGFALSGSGVVLIATAFAEFELLVGLAAALVVAAVVYLGMGFALPNAQLRTRSAE